jgi:predicted NBD/HSP70 family sugar kinase
MYIVLDLGGTKTRIATCPDINSPTCTEIARLETKPDYAQHMEQLVGTIKKASAEPIQGIGFAIGAQLTRDGRAIDMSYTMPDFVHKPIVDDLAQPIGCTVRASNDNVCAVLSETGYGSLGRFERAAYLTISTGTGAGVRLSQGDKGIVFLSQIGHHMIDPDGDLCRCGQIGCVQTITGGRQIESRFGHRAEDLDDQTAWETIARAVAIAIVNLVRITRVDAVCIGGGIGMNSAYLRQHVPELVKQFGQALSVEILYPVLGADAPLVGAAMLLRDDLSVDILH